MTLDDIARTACDKVGRRDTFSFSLAQDFAQIRQKQVYEAFDWKVAQTSVIVNIDDPPTGAISIPGVDKIISVRYFKSSENSWFLDPVSLEFLYESGYELSSFLGEPRFYVEFWDASANQRTITLYPTPTADNLESGTNVSVVGKKAFDASASVPLIPYTDTLLIALVTADMLETLHQVGKSDDKLKEAETLLEKAKALDSPSTARPRQSKFLTVSGNSLEELADSVCDLIGRWEPEVRISAKEKIRRNWQTLWEMALWAESTVVARVTATDREQLILPPFFDRAIAVRPDDGSIQQLRNAEVSLFFNIDPQIFERDQDPVYFSVISPTATDVLPPYTEPITCILMGNGSCGPLILHSHWSDEVTKVFFKGEGNGVEAVEELTVHTMPPVAGPCRIIDIINTGATTSNSYDTPLTLSKGITKGTLEVYGTISHRLLMTLSPNERERKHIRLWLLPNRRIAFQQIGGIAQEDPTPKTYLVLGKRKMSPLIADNDTTQLRNCENILINGAAADMLTKSDPALSTSLRNKAGELLKVLIDGETKQSAYEPTITPYVEPTYQLK